MPLFAWDERDSVGIARLDEQRRRLVDMIDQFHVAMTAGQGKRSVNSILAALIGPFLNQRGVR